MELLFLYILIGASAFLFFHSIIAERMRRQEAGARLGLQVKKHEEGMLLLNLFGPFLPDLSRRLKQVSATRYRNWVEKKLITAGLISKLNVEEFWGFQILMGLLMPLLFGTLFSLAHLLPGTIGGTVFILLLLGATGLAFPCLWLRGVIAARQKEIRFAMAPAVDLVSISVEAGLDFITAISRVVEKSTAGPLAEEWKQMLHEIQMGLSREQALRNFADRVDDMNTSSFDAVLIQADRLGASIGPALKAQAVKMRTERFQAAQRAGAAASQKILLPPVFFIIPAVFIVIFAPIVLQSVSGGMGGAF